MAFLTPLFLIGAVGAALPVLVHLVRRTRAQRVEFASLMFLRRIDQKTVRRKKLRNLMLLAMRCAAILLLALAFARPYFPSQVAEAARGDELSTAILIDESYSMRFPGVFDRARTAALDVIGSAATGERLAVIAFSHSYRIAVPFDGDRSLAVSAIEQMEAGIGATDYLQAIQAASGLLNDVEGSRRRIYLISDFQKPGWDRLRASPKIPAGIELVPIDVAEAGAANVAVTDLKADPIVYGQKYAGKITARLSNFGAQSATDATVEFKLNDSTVERRQLAVQAGSEEYAEFSGFNVPEGVNRASIEVTGDPFEFDNRVHFILERANQQKVLIIDTATRGRSESFFLQQALLVGQNRRYDVSVKTAGSANPAEIKSYDAVIVNDVGVISDALASALRDYVESGGGLVIAAGKNTTAAEFNHSFAAVSPAVLEEVVQGRGSHSLMSYVRTDHPIFGIFSRGGRLATTRVYAYHKGTPAESASVIAALDDGSPLIVEALAGAGKVILFTTTLDTAWNDLPLTPMFLPLVHQVLEHLAGRHPALAHTAGQSFIVAADREGAVPSIDSPGGIRLEELQKSGSGELLLNPSETGFYRVRYRDRTDYAAVNLDPREADLTRLDIDEFIAAVSEHTGGSADRRAEALDLTPAELEARQRLWLPILLAALALFVAEAVIARRVKLARLIR